MAIFGCYSYFLTNTWFFDSWQFDLNGDSILAISKTDELRTCTWSHHYSDWKCVHSYWKDGVVNISITFFDAVRNWLGNIATNSHQPNMAKIFNYIWKGLAHLTKWQSAEDVGTTNCLKHGNKYKLYYRKKMNTLPDNQISNLNRVVSMLIQDTIISSKSAGDVPSLRLYLVTMPQKSLWIVYHKYYYTQKMCPKVWTAPVLTC